jgi:hypothetical protein
MVYVFYRPKENTCTTQNSNDWYLFTRFKASRGNIVLIKRLLLFTKTCFKSLLNVSRFFSKKSKKNNVSYWKINQWHLLRQSYETGPAKCLTPNRSVDCTCRDVCATKFLFFACCWWSFEHNVWSEPCGTIISSSIIDIILIRPRANKSIISWLSMNLICFQLTPSFSYSAWKYHWVLFFE